MAQLPKIVSQRLQRSAAMGDHPDPNLLAAFVERSLEKREQLDVLRHLSQCTSCREIVSLSAPQPDIATASAPAPESRRWLSFPVLRWGAVLACVLIVGAAVTLRQKPESRVPVAPDRTSTPESQLAVTNSVAANLTTSLQKNVGMKPAPVKPASSLRNPIDAKSARSAHSMTPGPTNPGPTNPVPVEMAEAKTASPFADIVPGRAKDAAAESQSAPTARTMAGTLALNKDMMPPATSDAFLADNLIPRWTLSSDGTLQRSLDSGRTWETIPVSSQTIFRALSANGLDIWVGGAAGSLFHSSDAGQHWTQVRPVVNGEALKDDIIRVDFRDALHGNLTSSVQENWITSDAGQTWQKQ